MRNSAITYEPGRFFSVLRRIKIKRAEPRARKLKGAGDAIEGRDVPWCCENHCSCIFR